MWTKDNDHLAVEAQLNALTEAKVTAAQKREEAREQKAAAHAQRAEAARERTSNKMAAEAARRKMQSQRTTKPPAASGQVEATPDAKDRRERGRDTSSKRDRSTTGRQRPKSKSPQSAKSAQGHRAERSTRPASKGDGGRRSPKKAAPTFNVGDRCRLERGIFAGKEGVIAAKGKPGYYSVKVGCFGSQSQRIRPDRHRLNAVATLRMGAPMIALCVLNQLQQCQNAIACST